MADVVKDDLERMGKGSGTPIPQSDPKSDFVTTVTGKQVYDRGETVVAKMNRERAAFDKDVFFQELFENYLVSVERHEPRQLPDSRIITYWDVHTSFDDFLTDSLKVLEKKIDAIKFAKSVGTQRFSAIGDSVLDDPKFKPDVDADAGVVKKKIDAEDCDAVYELLRRAKEAIEDCKAGRATVICNSKTGRVRVSNSVGLN